MKLALAFFFTLTLALHAQDQGEAPTTINELSAVQEAKDWESVPPAKQYTREQVDQFLDQYVGVWEGDYQISAMQSRGLVTLAARTTYFWELVGSTRVLKGQNVYASGDQLTHAESLSYFWDGRVVSEVEQDGLKRIFIGQISPEGDSVNWTVANTSKATATATRESFATNDAGKSVLLVKGYEEMTKGGQVAYLQLSAELIKSEDE